MANSRDRKREEKITAPDNGACKLAAPSSCPGPGAGAGAESKL